MIFTNLWINFVDKMGVSDGLFQVKESFHGRSNSCRRPLDFFPAGGFEGNARRMSRVVASTEFG
jgi:hypothetical protein